jgi:hypothetical protein
MFFDRFPASQNAETSSAPFHVVWRVYPHLDLAQMSAMLSGIAILERRKVISLSVEFMSAAVEAPYSALELVVTERRTGTIRKVVVDFYDRADKILPQALEFRTSTSSASLDPRLELPRAACTLRRLPLRGSPSPAFPAAHSATCALRFWARCVPVRRADRGLRPTCCVVRTQS